MEIRARKARFFAVQLPVDSRRAAAGFFPAGYMLGVIFPALIVSVGLGLIALALGMADELEAVKARLMAEQRRAEIALERLAEAESRISRAEKELREKT